MFSFFHKKGLTWLKDLILKKGVLAVNPEWQEMSPISQVFKSLGETGIRPCPSPQAFPGATDGSQLSMLAFVSPNLRHLTLPLFCMGSPGA